MATKGKKLIKFFKDLGLNLKYDTPEELEVVERDDRQKNRHKINYSSYFQFSMEKMQQKVK